MNYYLLLLAPQDLEVRVREPVPADPWTETFTGRCGRDELQIIRPMRPSGGRATIRVNGLPVRGEVEALAHELSDVRASYRFSFLCPQEDGNLSLRWVEGLADKDGAVSYRSGSAAFRGNQLLQARAEDANERTFWFR